MECEQIKVKGHKETQMGDSSNKQGVGTHAHTIDIGVRKEVITKFMSAVRSNLMNGTALEFFEKHDKKKTGFFTLPGFLKLARGSLKISKEAVPDVEIGQLEQVLQFDVPSKDGIQLASLASYVEMGPQNFINSVKRKLQADLSRGPEVYDPLLELGALKEALRQEQLLAEKLTSIHPETPRYRDLDRHVTDMQRELEANRATRRPPPPEGQILSVNGALGGLSLVDFAQGEYMARREVQRMAAVPPVRTDPSSPRAAEHA